MATNIYWFSGTGNSLAVARQLAAQLDDASLLALPEAPAAAAGSRAIVVFPVYCLGLPAAVADWLASPALADCSYCATVASYGGIAGAPHAIARQLFAKQQITLDSGFSVKMPDNYLPMFSPGSTTKQAKRLAAATTTVERISRCLQTERRGVFEDSLPPLRWLAPRLTGIAARQFAVADRRFVVSSRCNGCGLCRKVCPVANISLEAAQPRWHQHCQQCLACLQWCPQQAIDLGRRTVAKPRYHHPDVVAADLCRRSDSPTP